MTKNPRRARALLAATALTLLGSVGGLAAAPTSASAAVARPSAITATVPNMFANHQLCSRISGRCRYLGYWQENGNYNPNVPSTYIGWITTWTWSWI